MDYASLDRQKILAYLKENGGTASVNDIITHSGAESLRIYSLIQQLKLKGEIIILKESSFGAPVAIQMSKY